MTEKEYLKWKELDSRKHDLTKEELKLWSKLSKEAHIYARNRKTSLNKTTQLDNSKNEKISKQIQLVNNAFQSSVDADAKLRNIPIQPLQEYTELKRLNTWQPAINAADLLASTAGLVTLNPVILGANTLTNGILFSDDLVNDRPYAKSLIGLGFDALGWLGKFDVLKNINIPWYRRVNTTNRRGLPVSRLEPIVTGDQLDAAADIGGKGYNIKDIYDDAADLYQTVKESSYTDYTFEPFKADGGTIPLRNILYDGGNTYMNVPTTLAPYDLNTDTKQSRDEELAALNLIDGISNYANFYTNQSLKENLKNYTDSKIKQVLDYTNLHKAGSLGYGLSPIKQLEISKDILGREFNSSKPQYIGGTSQEVRDKYWENYPNIKDLVEQIAKIYNISPSLLLSRLSKEGIIDTLILKNNERTLYNSYKEPIGKTLELLLNSDTDLVPNDGYALYGLDDVASYIDSEKVKLLNNESYHYKYKNNEKGRQVHSASGESFLDNVGLMAATLKYMRDKAAKDYPNASAEELDKIASFYYNHGPYAKYKDNGGNLFYDGGTSTEVNPFSFDFGVDLKSPTEVLSDNIGTSTIDINRPLQTEKLLHPNLELSYDLKGNPVWKHRDEIWEDKESDYHPYIKVGEGDPNTGTNIEEVVPAIKEHNPVKNSPTVWDGLQNTLGRAIDWGMLLETPGIFY